MKIGIGGEKMEYKKVPIQEKYSLSIEEATEYFGIGSKTLRKILKDDPKANFIIMIGSHIRIKRKAFGKVLDQIHSV